MRIKTNIREIINTPGFGLWPRYIVAFPLFINIFLLLTFIFLKDIEFTFLLSGYLFFLMAFSLWGVLRVWNNILLFLLCSTPFFIIGFLYQSYTYFGSISWHSVVSIYPAFLYFTYAMLAGYVFGILSTLKYCNTSVKEAMFFSVTAYILSILFGALSWPYQFVATGLIYFLAGLFSPKGALRIKFVYYLLIISTHFVFYGLLALIIGNITVSPIVIIPFISTGLGIWCIGLVRRKSLLIVTIAGLIYVSTIILGYWGMQNYLEYIFGLEKKPYINELKLDLYDSLGNSITEKDIKGKTAVLYFHTKSCAVCYKKLPDLESLYQDFVDDTSVMVIGVNIPLSIIEDTSYVMDHYRRSQYTFPQYFSRGLSSDYEYRFNIDGYPHVTIIGKNGDVIHNGRFNYDPTIIVDNAYKLVLSDIVNE